MTLLIACHGVLFNSNRVKNRSFSENLTSILDIELPQPPEVRKDDRQTECGVCYAKYLPIGMFSPILAFFPPRIYVYTSFNVVLSDR